MDNSLQHDPRTKQQIKDTIYDFIYKPTLSQLESRLMSIIDKNDQLSGIDAGYFVYKSKTYARQDATVQLKRQRLATVLHPFMDQYISEVTQLNNFELPYVLGFISSVLNSSNELQDYLRVLPDAVHRPVQKLIASCPCRTVKLTNDAVMDLKIQHQMSINLIKQRLVTNLLI